MITRVTRFFVSLHRLVRCCHRGFTLSVRLVVRVRFVVRYCPRTSTESLTEKFEEINTISSCPAKQKQQRVAPYTPSTIQQPTSESNGQQGDRAPGRAVLPLARRSRWLSRGCAYQTSCARTPRLDTQHVPRNTHLRYAPRSFVSSTERALTSTSATWRRTARWTPRRGCSGSASCGRSAFGTRLPFQRSSRPVSPWRPTSGRTRCCWRRRE